MFGGQSSSDGSGGTSTDATTIMLRAFDDGTLRFQLRDQDDNEITAETSGLDSVFSDGNKHRYAFRKSSNSDSGLGLYQDATDQPMVVNSNQSFGNVIDFDLNAVQLGRMAFNGGFTGRNINMVVDDVVIYTTALSSSEIQDDYDIQPWT